MGWAEYNRNIDVIMFFLANLRQGLYIAMSVAVLFSGSNLTKLGTNYIFSIGQNPSPKVDISEIVYLKTLNLR